MRIVQITTDNREPFRQYDRTVPWFGAAPEALLEGFAAFPEVEVHVLGCTQKPMRASPEKLAPNIWFHSLHVPKLGWMRTAYQGCVRAVRRRVQELKPDLVHGQGTERECSLSAIFSGFPNVLTIHGNMAELARFNRDRPFTFGWLAARLENFALPRSAGVFCNSAYTESLVRPRARRTWRVANPLRQPFFAPVPAGERPTPARLLNVGVVSPRKRQVEMLDLAAKLHAEGVPIVFDFVGACPGADAYQNVFLEKLAVAERAGFACWSKPRPVEALIPLFDQATGVLHFPGEEAFGLVVGEALARNLKFFGARLGGVQDIADGVEGAELFSAEDWEGLGRAIAAWVKAGAPRPRQAATTMADRYSPQVIAARHLEIYREVLSSRV